MSEIFEGYERQYCELSANLSRKCTSILALHGGTRWFSSSSSSSSSYVSHVGLRLMIFEAFLVTLRLFSFRPLLLFGSFLRVSSRLSSA
jgi:hypothetical protein